MHRSILAAIACFTTVSVANAGDLEANKQLVRDVIDQVFNNRQPAAEDRYLAVGYIEHNPRLPQGLDGQKQFVSRVLTGFSDYHGEIQDIVAEGDKVVARIQWTGTQDGPFLGMPPSMRKVSFATADTFRIADGKLAEHWDVVDSLPRALALGLVQPVDQPSTGPGKKQ